MARVVPDAGRSIARHAGDGDPWRAECNRFPANVPDGCGAGFVRCRSGRGFADSNRPGIRSARRRQAGKQQGRTGRVSRIFQGVDAGQMAEIAVIIHAAAIDIAVFDVGADEIGLEIGNLAIM